jgi:ubiquinone/menaquinone biosynthesis C-methylase UbiE/uncharacterized protein YbaR (Trm112 family)
MKREIPIAPVEQRRRMLERVAPLLRLPSAPASVPEVLADGSGLRCPVTGRVYPYRDGILDLLGEDLIPTRIQRFLDTPATAWGYDRVRDLFMRSVGLPPFPREVAAIQRRLLVGPGDVVLDLACGHGNFTIEWAKRVGPGGLVIGLDISAAMLARAAGRVVDWDLDNVLLVRGDALRLPLADAVLDKANCSGGFHQLPDLPRALWELARASKPGATLAASTFASEPGDRRAFAKGWIERRSDLHFVPLERLGEQLQAAGYQDYSWSLPGGWFGYGSAIRTMPIPIGQSGRARRGA